MNLGFLKHFSLRQKIMTAMAVLFPICSFLMVCEAGFGALAVLLLSVIVGTIVFVTTAGRDRCFFTGLFTFLLFGICLVADIANMIEGERVLSSRFLCGALLFFLLLVVCPTAFAWIVTRFSNLDKPNT